MTHKTTPRKPHTIYRSVLSRVALSVAAAIFLLVATLALLIGVSPAQAQTGMEIGKFVSADTVIAGDTFQYTIVVTNNTGYSVNTVISDTIPAGVTIVDPGTGTASDGVIVWNDTMGNGESRSYVFSVRDTIAEEVVNADYVVRSGDSSTYGAPVTTTVAAGPPAQVMISAAPNPNTAGDTTAITVTLADQYGNTIHAATPVTLTYAAGRIDGDASGTVVTTTDAAGVLVVALDGITQPSTTRVTAEAGGFSNYVDVTYTHGPPASLTMSILPDTIPAPPGGQSAQIVATVTDAYGNPDTSDVVTFDASLGILDITNGGALNTLGRAYATLAGNRVAGTGIVTAAVGGLVQTGTVTLTPGPAEQIFVAADPLTIPVTADGSATAAITATVKDQYGNLVDPTVVTFTTSLGTFPGDTTAITGTTANGETYATLASGTTAGYAEVRAWVNNLYQTAWVYFAPDTPAAVSLAVAPAEIYADGVDTAIVTATVTDRFGNLVDVPVPLTVTTGYGTLADSFLTAENGVATTTLRSSTDLVTDPLTVTAENIITPAYAAVDFVVGPPTAADISLNPTAPITVGVPITMTAIARDSVGHPVPNVPLALATSLGWLMPDSGTTDSGGQIRVTLESTRTGTANFSANSDGTPLSIQGTSTADFLPDVSVMAALEATPMSVYADGHNTVSIIGTLLDRFGNHTHEAGITPTFTTTHGTLDAPSASDTNGIINRLLTTDTALGDTVVSVTDMVTPTAVTITFTTGPIARAYLDATPSAVIAGNPVTLRITTTDSVDHLLPNQTFVVTRTLGSNPLPCTATDANGVLTCSSVVFTQTTYPQIYVNGIAAQGDTITVSPAPLDHIAISPRSHDDNNPIEVTAGVPFTFTAQAYDRYNNPRTDSITWMEPSGHGGTGTILDGVFIGEKAGIVLLNAQAADAPDYTYVNVNAGPPARVRITPNPDTVPADNASTSDLTLEILDEYDNPVGENVYVYVESTLGTLEGEPLTDVDGVLHYTLRSGQTGVAAISAAAGPPLTITPDSNPYVTFTPGTPHHASISASTTALHEWQGSTLKLHANGVDTATLRITILDAQGNPVDAGYAVTVEASPDTLSGFGTTDANGVITRTIAAPTTAQPAVITVTYLSPLPVYGDSVEFFVGPLDRVEIEPHGPYTITAGVPAQFTAYGYDEANAEVPPETMQAYIWSYLQTGTGDGEYLAGEASQQATFMGTIAGVGPRLTVLADDGSSIKAGSLDLTVLPAPPITATAAVTPLAVTVGYSVPFTITLSDMTDLYGNAPLDGEPITVTVFSQPATRTMVGTVVGNRLQVSENSTIRAGTYTFTAESAAGTMALSGTNTVTFVPDVPARAEVLAAAPPRIVADGIGTGTVTLQLQDWYRNPVGAGFTPTITSSIGTILTPPMPTDANGTVTHTLQADFTVGDVIFYLDGFPADGVPVSLISGPPVSAVVTATTTTLTVGGEMAQLVFDVRDEWNHPVGADAPITPTITPSLGWWDGARTPFGGLVTQTLHSGHTAGVAVVGSTGITVTGDITYTFLPAAPAQVLVRASNTPITVGNTITVTAWVSDTYGNAAFGEPLTITADLGEFSGGAATITPTTDARGMVTFTLYSEEAGLEWLRFWGRDGETAVLDASDDIIFEPDVPQTVVITPTAATVRANIPQQFTVSSLDRFGNAVDDWTPVDYLWHQTSAVNAAGYGTLTSVGGHARTVEFLPQIVGENTLYATGGIQESNHVPVTVTTGYPDIATVSLSSVAVQADGVSPFTVTVTAVTDAFGNPIAAGTPLTVTVPSFPAISAAGVYTGGVMTVVMTANTHAGVYPIQISGEGHQAATINGDDIITFLPGPPARAVVTATPTEIPADGVSTAQLLVTVEDEYFNRVADGTLITVTTSLGTIDGAGITINGQITRTLVSTPTLGTAVFAVSAPNGELFTSGDTVDFVVGASSVAWLDATPANVVADGTSTAQLVFTIKDSALFDTGVSGTAVITADHGTLVPTTTLVSGGVFTVGFTSDMTVSTVGLDVMFNGTPMTLAGDTLRQIPGIPTSATISSTVGTLHAGEDEHADLTVTILDDRGRPIIDGSVVTVTTSIGSVLSNATTSLTGQVTRTLIPGSEVGSVVFTVTVETPWGDVVTLEPVADPVQIVAGRLASIVVHPTSPLDVTAGVGVTLIAVGYDAFGNDTGQRNFSWRYWSGSCPVDLEYCVSQPGNGDGVLSGTVVSTSPLVLSNAVFTGTLAGAVGIKAYTGTIFSNMLDVTVHSGAPATATVAANPKTIYVGGETSELVITIKDSFGNLVENTNPRIVTDLDTIIGDSPVVNGVTTRTLVSGKYFGTVHVYVDDFEAGGDHVLIAPKAIVSAEPDTLLADGESTAQLTIQVFDTDGDFVPDGTVPTITGTLGSISGSGGTLNGVFTRTLTAGMDVGTAQFFVDGNQAEGVVTFTVGPPTHIAVDAIPNFLPADGSSQSLLTFVVEDDYGHTIADATDPLTITASAGTLSDFAPTVGGVTTRTLTAANSAGKASITVDGWDVTGDVDIFFLDGGLKDGDFESGTFDSWAARNEITPTPQFSWWSSSMPAYQATIVSTDVVGGKVITPYSGTKMVRLGATVGTLCSAADLPGYPVVGDGYHSYEYPDNCPHQISEAWVSQSFYVPSDGVSQIQYYYRILGYDIAESESGREWDPFEVYRNGLELQQDGVPYSFDWYYGWYTQNPSSPIEAHPEDENGWHFGYFDVTPFKGQVVNIEFRVSNRTAPMDNTWVYLDDVHLVNIIPSERTGTTKVFLPLVMK